MSSSNCRACDGPTTPDPVTTERVCTVCGLVADGPVFYSPMRETDAVDGQIRSSVQNTPIAPSNVDALGKRIDAKTSRMVRRLRIHDIRAGKDRTGTSVPRCAGTAFSSTLGARPAVGIEAARIHRLWRKEHSVQNGMTKVDCVVASIVLAARWYKIPLDVPATAEKAEVNEDDVWTAIRRIKQQSSLPYIRGLVAEPIPIIGRAAGILRIPEPVRAVAIKLLEDVQDRGTKPSCMACAAIVLAFEEMKLKMPFDVATLAKACWTTEPCVRKAISQIRRNDSGVIYID